MPWTSAVDLSQLVAGINGGGNLPDLAYFAPTGTGAPAAPTDATTPFATGFVSPGGIDQNGFTETPSSDSSPFYLYGITAAARVFAATETITGKIVMAQTNAVSIAIYRKMPLPGQTGAPAVTASTGQVASTSGPARTYRMQMGIVTTDGLNASRWYYPNVEVTDKDPIVHSTTAPDLRGVTVTAYPDNSGNSGYYWDVVNSLKTA